MFFYKSGNFIMIYISLFAFLVYAVANDLTIGFDMAIINFIHNFKMDMLTTIMLVITYLGEFHSIAIMVILTSIYFFAQKRYDCIVFIIILNSISPLINHLLKEWFQRPRPNIFPYHLYSSFSFPSGHAMAAMVFFGGVLAMLWYIKKEHILMTIFSLIIVTLIGLSRIYLGVHYPTDIIGGYLTGTIWIVFFIILFKLSVPLFKQSTKN